MADAHQMSSGIDPDPIQTLAPLGALDFHDSRYIDLPYNLTALEAWTCATTPPLPFLKTAFVIRDTIAARFGVKRIGGFSGAPVTSVQVGDHLDFFLVEDISDQSLTLTERDRHLDVMTCVTTHTSPAQKTAKGTRVTITSSVITHNWIGKAYMLPVAPAHKLIVHRSLRQLFRAAAPQKVAPSETSRRGS